MNQPLNKTSKRLAQAAVLTLAITGISAPSFALTQTSTFTINVNEYVDPCSGAADYPATWLPDSYVTLSDSNDPFNQNNPGQILVNRGATVAMSVGLGFQDGEECFVTMDPDGTVTATWTMPLSGDVALDNTEICVAGAAPCSAADTNSIYATALVSPAATYGGINSGSVFIEWIPADNSTP
jgi:hypothetical protein